MIIGNLKNNKRTKKAITSLLNTFLVFIVLFLLAQLAWRIIVFIFINDFKSNELKSYKLNSSSNEVLSDKNASNVAFKINKLNFFGVPFNGSKKDLSNIDLTNQPKTTLPVKLNGLLVSSEPLKSMAIIDYKKKQGSYFIGDEITAGVSVVSINAKGVLIDENGIQTLLTYDTDERSNNKNLTQSTNSSAKDNELDTALRDELLTSPQKLLDYVSISPVKEEDKLVGYRVNPGKNPKIFEELGFQAGDVAIEINGVDLTNELESLSLLADINTITFASIHVKRNNEVHIIDVNLAE